MYYYPVITTCSAVSFIGIILSSVLAIIWKRVFEPNIVVKVDTLNDQRVKAKVALEKSPQQKKAIQRVQLSYREHLDPDGQGMRQRISSGDVKDCE